MRMGKKPKASRDRNARARAPVLILCLAAALLAPLYYPARSMTFLFDDRVTILNNEKIQDPSIATVIMENPFRAMVNLTFALQHALHAPEWPGSPKRAAEVLPFVDAKMTSIGNIETPRLVPVYKDPLTGKTTPLSLDRERGLAFPRPPALPFRLFNLILHAANGIALFLVLKRLGSPAEAAALAAAAFMVHPLATETVNYVTARFSLMALLFCLVATYFWLGEGRSKKRLFLALLFYVLALFCKETAAVLPVILFILDLARGRLDFSSLLGLLPAAAYAALRSAWTVILTARPDELLPLPIYFSLEQRALWLYVVKIFFPVNLNFDYHFLPSPPADFAFAALNAAVIAAALYAIIKIIRTTLKSPDGPTDKREKKAPVNWKEFLFTPRQAGPLPWALALFLLTWISLLPTSVIPLGDAVKEDRAYAALAMIFPALVLFLYKWIGRGSGAIKKVAPIAAALAVICLTLLTQERNRDWSGELSLYRDGLSKSPGKPRAIYNYANALKWSGDLDESLRWFQMTLAADPGNEDARENIKAILQTMRALSGGAARPDLSRDD